MRRAERQRQRVRRRYYRSFVAANEARALVELLTRQQRTLIAGWQGQVPDSRALRRYVAATALADELREEKQSLTELVNERAMLQHRISHILGDRGAFASPTDAGGLSGTSRQSLTFRPLTVQDCKELTGAFYSDIKLSMRSQIFGASSRSLFGWGDNTQRNGLCIKFSLQKAISGHSATELSSRSWQLTSSPTHYSRVYSAALTSTVERLQVVDEDNVVLYERFSRPGVSGFCHTLFLASRIRIENGFVEICQPLDPSRVQGAGALTAADSARVWVETEFWTMLQDEQSATTSVTVGGTINGSTNEDTSFWMLELLLVAMRWENKLVPRFCLTSK